MSDLVKPGSGVLFMKVGTHAKESIESIIERKRKEIDDAGFALWGFGGGTCHPTTMVQPFASAFEKLLPRGLDEHAGYGGTGHFRARILTGSVRRPTHKCSVHCPRSSTHRRCPFSRPIRRKFTIWCSNSSGSAAGGGRRRAGFFGHEVASW